jgi:hypothetical protein
VQASSLHADFFQRSTEVIKHGGVVRQGGLYDSRFKDDRLFHPLFILYQKSKK